VYVVDDDPSFVRSTVRLLASWDLRAEGFTSATTFLERAVGEGPACLLLDVRMPEMSGLEVQRTLHATARRIPVVFVSGHADVQIGVEAMKEGAVDFLPKPVDEERLLDAVRRALAADAAAAAARRRARDARDSYARLDHAEREVCRLVVTGMRDEQIAQELGWARGTVRSARRRAMEALSATSLIELVRALEAAQAD
jgi:FixJ family two-component response regulator